MNNPNKLFPLIITDKLAETRSFYLDKAGFVLSFENEHYLQVRATQEEGSPELCFMTPHAMPEGPTFPPFAGQGLVMSVPTPDADAKVTALEKAGVTNVPRATDKPWGWRSFFIPDPNGMLIDFFHVIDQKKQPDA